MGPEEPEGEEPGEPGKGEGEGERERIREVKKVEKLAAGKGWMLKEYQPGAVPRVMNVEGAQNRRSECVVLEGN